MRYASIASVQRQLDRGTHANRASNWKALSVGQANGARNGLHNSRFNLRLNNKRNSGIYEKIQ